MAGICHGANDEIFQGQTPILTGIDLDSTYTYLLEEAPDRTSDTWELYMSDRKDHGLNLETSTNDGGAGLMSGIPKVFDDIEMQADTFHAVYEMGKIVSQIERKALSQINREYDLEKGAARKNPRQKTIDELKEAIPQTKAILTICDTILILYTWLKELLGFSGYDMRDSTKLIEFILLEMENVAVGYPKLLKECAKVRKNIPLLLSFIRRLDIQMEKYATDLNIPPEAFRIMYRQRSCGTDSQQYQNLEYQLVLMLMHKYNPARDMFQKLLNETHKASSLVENLNGRIRVYIEMKRVIPTHFFVLMKVYFNTRKYRRSRCPERVGKSPLELLTGKPQPDFLVALGF